ncbi:MAG: FAD:protein FMN transferase [Alistipes sp.]|nr:FAD:protein FMN transferase [Alistipes sp.]
MFANNQNIVRLFAVLCIALLLGACSTPKSEFLTIEGEALGTFVQVKCNTSLDDDELIAIVRRIDTEAKESMSIFNESSLLSKINRNDTDSLDCHIIRNIELAERFSKLSNGAYDITIKPLTEAWGFAAEKSDGSTPNIDSLLDFVGYNKILVCDGRLCKADTRVEIDLNSIAKGYTVDLVAEELEKRGITDYMVNIGGEIRCRGVNAKSERWTIGIETPYDGNMSQESFEKIIDVTDCAIATSGNYRRFYLTNDGRKVAHTLDPRTGYSVISDLLSATVIAPTCAEADAAATMFMAMGSEGGAAELAQHCEEEFGWKYYFIYADGENYRIECSEELR